MIFFSWDYDLSLHFVQFFNVRHPCSIAEDRLIVFRSVMTLKGFPATGRFKGR